MTYNFNNDERNFLNKIIDTVDVPRADITREYVIGELELFQVLSASEFEYVIDRIIEKVNDVSDDDWENFIGQFPMDVDYTFDDVDEENQVDILDYLDEINGDD